ncbi:helix-turn-helix transcriptional regulator [Acetohalobium arabaticum]|uniref:Helix-turn-helix type 11 domain protein n=1 Tax=Acetohalobium arabaticum (strain ATCC 49924 / DSM 5501 / Z-7288) TaxID=574087 RepID=D9QVU2_ACEAZ|nr:YafY family protein [Acetohalobium arabaticum]ADL12351.1 helix-turn-helix type 11 domain protein [Acetohalobium arabaticum DSM 5501]
MKYDRLLRLTSLIDHIASAPGKNFQFYADKFGVAARTIRRDVDTLAEAGLPVETSAGIRFINDIELPNINFTYNEAFALMIALSELKRYTQFDGELEQVKVKLEEVFPDKLAEIAKEIEKRVGIYPSRTEIATEISDKMMPIISSLIDNRRLEIKYYSFSSDEVKWRKVDPYGVFFRRRSWYLAAYCHLADEVRTFRFSRVREWNHLREYFELPDDFNLDEYVTESWELMKGEPAEIEVKFASDVAQLILETEFNKDEEKELLKDGSVIYRVKVEGWREIFYWILSFGGDAEIIKPDWLRSKAEDEAKRMLKLYSS